MHDVGLFLADDAHQFAHRARGQFLAGILQFADPDVRGKQALPQAAPKRQSDGDGKFAAVQMAQYIQKLNPRAADVAVGDNV